MRLVTPESSAHWYTAAGEPRYDATLREARKENLLPSVTSITKIWPKGALEAWKQEQLIMAALTLPREADEPLDAFAHRIVLDGQQQAKTTAQWGTRFHDLCESLHKGMVKMKTGDLEEYFLRYYVWFDNNVSKVIRCEHNVVNLEHGYAGKLDLLAMINSNPPRKALGDIKSRSVKNGRAVFYDEQPMQLVAYGMALPADERPDCYFSVIINRDTPEPPYVKWYDENEIAKAWNDFMCLLVLWSRVNKYNPEIKDGPMGGFQCGLTKRELFAAMAMQGMLADSEVTGTQTEVAASAVGFADALIAELNRKANP